VLNFTQIRPVGAVLIRAERRTGRADGPSRRSERD